MMQSDYLIELKRRRAITQSLTWQIALPFWKAERWIRELVAAAKQRHAPRNVSGPDQDCYRKPKNKFERLLIRLLAPVVVLGESLRHAPTRTSKFAGLPARTEEVYRDIQQERAQRALKSQAQTAQA